MGRMLHDGAFDMRATPSSCFAVWAFGVFTGYILMMLSSKGGQHEEAFSQRLIEELETKYAKRCRDKVSVKTDTAPATALHRIVELEALVSQKNKELYESKAKVTSLGAELAKYRLAAASGDDAARVRIADLESRLTEASQKPNPAKSFSEWRLSVKTEWGQWKQWLEAAPTKFKEDYAFRLNTNSTLKPFIQKELIRAMDEGQSHFTLLDVGAGPLTNVGFVMPEPPGATLEVIAVDRLAKLFDHIMPQTNTLPVKRTQQVLAEELTKAFPNNMFDLVFSNSALDRMRDPLAALREMLAVVKPGHIVYAGVTTNLAERERTDLWNFNVQDGRLVLWRKGVKVDVENELQAFVHSVETNIASTDAGVESTWMSIRLRRAGVF
mmetsp:Transcript_16914/g.48114  ORF Transcript_16914/g.48114 Transcript_16914/m.48114 type:complete len:382 (+) Transcript_16914:103-1248(+)